MNMIATGRSLRLAAAACLALMAAAGANANIVYTVNATLRSSTPSGNPLQTDTVVGTITTDGTLGALAAGNILSWDLDLIDTLDPSSSFRLGTLSSELVHLWGDALSATASGLFFDYRISGAEFLIQGKTPHPVGSGYNYFCLSATGGWCLAGETIAPGHLSADGVVLAGTALQALDQGPNGVPEPSVPGLVLIGLAGIASSLKRGLRG